MANPWGCYRLHIRDATGPRRAGMRPRAWEFSCAANESDTGVIGEDG